MAAIIIQNIASAPTGGAFTEYSGLTFSTGTLTKISGVLDTAFGRCLHKTGNGINGGMPNQGPLSYTLFGASASIVPAGGSYTKYSGLTFSAGTLTAIAGVLDTALGSYRIPRITRGLMGISTPSTLPGKAIVFVSM